MVSATKTITTSDNSTIRNILGSDKKLLATAAARLYYAEKGSKRWEKLKEAGAFTFIVCDEIFYFSLIDLDGKIVTWSQEIYLDFNYFKDDDNFYSFEADKGMIGILFADSQEAEEFYQTVLELLEGYTAAEKLPGKSKTKSKSKSIFGVFGFGKKSKKEDESSVEESETSEDVEPKKNKKKKETVKDTDLTHEDVSEPRDFTHLSHIGFNPEKGTFDIQNIPSEWKTLFAKAGITQDQLENRSTAKFIAGFVQDSEPQMNEIIKKQRGKPPVPVPMKKKAAPPPPPTPLKKAAPTSPLKSSQGPTKSTAPPPPPPKKKSTTKSASSSAPAPPPPPQSTSSSSSSSIPKPAASSSNHSALLESIRGAGIGILKPVQESSDRDSVSSPSSTSGTDPHSALMASIKGGANNLKPAPKTEKYPASPTSSVASADPTDMMAAMLAKALAARNKKLAADSSDDDEDSDDSRW